MAELLAQMVSLLGVLFVVLLSLIVGILVHEYRTPRSPTKAVEPMPPEPDGKD
jgi:hypothetical protein